MSKTIVCRCEDVTQAQIEQAIKDGMRDIESLKRYLAIGTGPCQGKNCLVIVARMLEQAGVPCEQIQPITPRPPLIPTPLDFFIGQDDEADGG
ncbi:MAG: (2Fe-2S)-binding protein [Candidatus Alcyoniella australis]|nr:(2Fe-2S)-binding protein [Candidatus Alcyoniella australis]